MKIAGFTGKPRPDSAAPEPSRSMPWAKHTTWPSAPPREQFEQSIDYLTAFEGRTKYKQGRLAEAEIDIRRALLSRLKANGKYNQDTAQIITIFARLMNEQARWADSEKLLRTALEIYQTLGYPDDTNSTVVRPLPARRLAVHAAPLR